MTPVTLSLTVDRDNAQIVAKFLLELFPQELNTVAPEPLKTDAKPKATTKPAEPKAKATPKEVESESTEKPQISLSDVRAKALLLSKDNRQDTLRALFEKYGGTKLSEIDKSKYKELLADMEAELNGAES